MAHTILKRQTANRKPQTANRKPQTTIAHHPIGCKFNFATCSRVRLKWIRRLLPRRNQINRHVVDRITLMLALLDCLIALSNTALEEGLISLTDNRLGIF